MSIKKKKNTQDNWVRTQLRLPPEIHVAISKFAKSHNISMNSAIILSIRYITYPNVKRNDVIDFMKENYL
ncbi:toxin-antitoxin system HicB family antitoxin [Dichelobacter nodosus]|uniref:toxin-antitoxin system HicB family antitoxin n=1 Tax=Dichelobacter nodosus TaxID=870 RepID=UPI000681A0D8|nr:hypothetical protein AKG33_03560 [Dichelobacter nodosus]